MDAVTVRRDGTTLLDGISWTIRDGERWVVIGPNGSGKTTLVHIAAGRTHPTSGTVSVLDEVLGLTDMGELRHRIGLSSAVLAEAIPPHESVLDCVVTAAWAVTGRWREAYAPADLHRAHALLIAMGISDLAARTFGTLSEGERKRVLIARALMTDPELLILDEPAAGLDVAGREDLIARLAALASDPAAPILILVTHHVEEIPPNFTDALLLSHGRISHMGPVHEIIDSEPMSEAFETPLWVEFGDDRWYARGRQASQGRRAKKF